LSEEMPQEPYTHSEQFRHRCEVRWLLAKRTQLGTAGQAWLKGYLQKPAVQHRRKQLEDDLFTQWQGGNRGEKGVWVVS